MTTLSTDPLATTPTATLPTETFRAHFADVRAELDALVPAQLVQLSLDVTAAVATALGALPRLRTLRPQVATLPAFDLARFDRLETYARAAGYAHAAYLTASQPPEPMPALHDQATRARNALLVAAEALAQKGLLPGDRLSDLRSGTGYRDTAADLIALAGMFTRAWPTVSSRTAVSASDLTEAESLASRLLVGVGARELSNPTVVQAAGDRHRAVTLFVTAYDQARRAVAFLRWNEDDADSFAPPLYNRTRASRRDERTPPVPATASGDETTPATDGPSAATTATTTVTHASTANARPIAPSDPFAKS